MIAAGLSSALLTLGACGDSSDSSTPTASPAASGSSTPAASAPASPSAKPTKAPASTNLDAVKVTGDYGKEPKVTVKTPWGIDKTRTKVLKSSNGATIKAGQTVEVNYYGVNGRTGKKFDDSFSR
ncbi:MAG: peptidylprolyl isomerase, partial [Propionibacteriaceae bacterium]|nr:peptidylprolyl isomerase [Propionibacteriaceae bacterium]